MKCPRCEEFIPYLLCEGCGEKIPEGSRFCCWCGNAALRKGEESDFSDRELCLDGSCIGVINESGACNICGKPKAG
ncbi:MAG: hypothetical protein FJ123_05810 [Deltaproteobacteria bacterium]|nr:hypothetical protein [Deltaproteobacteria bacterium]